MERLYTKALVILMNTKRFVVTMSLFVFFSFVSPFSLAFAENQDPLDAAGAKSDSSDKAHDEQKKPDDIKTAPPAEPSLPAQTEETEETEKKVKATPAVMSSSQIFDQDGELVVDVYETTADFVVLATIAGVQIKDIDISLEKDMMVIKGNRCDPHMHADKRYFYQECYWGPFSRKIVLPENIDIDKADAQIDKGILTVKIPKNEVGNGKIGIKIG